MARFREVKVSLDEEVFQNLEEKMQSLVDSANAAADNLVKAARIASAASADLKKAVERAAAERKQPILKEKSRPW